jgi:hypothetical protein
MEQRLAALRAERTQPPAAQARTYTPIRELSRPNKPVSEWTKPERDRVVTQAKNNVRDAQRFANETGLSRFERQVRQGAVQFARTLLTNLQRELGNLFR